MFVKAHPPVSTPAANNKGSCTLLAEYLEKENSGKDLPDKMAFFSHTYDEVSKGSVIKNIDGNTKNLGRNDNKFFMLSVNPSGREMQHIVERCTGKSNVNDFNLLSDREQTKVFNELRSYTRDVMDIYAKNFNRDNVKSGSDLVYFAKIETVRKWHHYDKDVRNGNAVAGTLKPGLNLHVHIIVSRNDKTQTTKLSPLSKSKGGTQILNGKSVMQGFNHQQWKQQSADHFNTKYNYKPYSKEYYNFNNSPQKEPVSSSNRPSNRVMTKVKNVVKNEALNGHFGNERKAVSNVVRAARLIANPKAAIISELKNKIASIILPFNQSEK